MTAAPSPLRSRVLPAAAGVAMVAILAAGAWYGYDYVTSRPIRHVAFVGDTGPIARADLDAFAQSVRGLGPNGASLDAVRDAARRIPWVRDAAVRRRFPDSIEVGFETYEPLARWADGGLVSTRGEVFVAEHPAFLPVFKGARGAARAMAQTYPGIARAVAPLASAIVEVRVSARGAWQLVLESGLTLELGREDMIARIQRFVAASPRLPSGALEGKVADLRYANGFAMRVAQQGKRK
jgi:cell division protein FtsQ